MATPAENANDKPESIDPTGFWRFVFWLAYVIGNLVLLFSILLSMVPGRIHRGEFTFYYIIRFCLAGPMLISILMAKWIWDIRSPFDDRVSSPPVAMRMVVLVAWVELALAVLSILAIAKLQVLGR